MTFTQMIGLCAATIVEDIMSDPCSEKTFRELLCDPRCANMFDVLVPFVGVEAMRELAYNTGTPVHMLFWLSKNIDAGVRWRVAENRNTPAVLLEQLSKDNDINVRWSVAYNPKTPVGVLEHLSADDDATVRYYVARNTNTPIDILERLSLEEANARK